MNIISSERGKFNQLYTLWFKYTPTHSLLTDIVNSL